MDDKDPVTFQLGHEELVIRQRYETLSIANDFLMALWFLVGSILFFAASYVLLVQSAAVGLVFFPAQYFRVPGASVAVLIAMMVFFLWLVAAGVALLRWRPPAPA